MIGFQFLQSYSVMEFAHNSLMRKTIVTSIALLRIRLSDEDDYKTLTIEQLLTLQIRMKNEYDGRWYWCSVFVRGRNGIYLNFFDGEDGKDCKRMLRIKL